MNRAAIVLVTIASLASVAVADVPELGPEQLSEPEPDPEATRAGDANLVTQEKRQGFMFGASLGPSVTIGKGTGTGNGATLSLKLGQVATSRTVIAFELNAGAQLRRVSTGPMDSELRTNNIASLLAGAQYWFRPSVWIRFNGGIGIATCTKCNTDESDRRRVGLAGGGGLGVDIVRFKGLVLGFEAYSVGQLNKDGFLVTMVSALSLSMD